MGWVRGQTGEQKRKAKQSKDLPGLGSGGIPAGRLWLGCRPVVSWRAASLGGRGTQSATAAALLWTSQEGGGGAGPSEELRGKGRDGRGEEGREGREAWASSRDPGPQ